MKATLLSQRKKKLAPLGSISGLREQQAGRRPASSNLVMVSKDDDTVFQTVSQPKPAFLRNNDRNKTLLTFCSTEDCPRTEEHNSYQEPSSSNGRFFLPRRVPVFGGSGGEGQPRQSWRRTESKNKASCHRTRPKPLENLASPGSPQDKARSQHTLRPGLQIPAGQAGTTPRTTTIPDMLY